MGTVGNSATGIPFAIFIKALVLKMFMFAINGDKDILKDNGRTGTLFGIIIIII